MVIDYLSSLWVDYVHCTESFILTIFFSCCIAALRICAHCTLLGAHNHRALQCNAMQAENKQFTIIFLVTDELEICMQ